jgi:hypothetical protein
LDDREVQIAIGAEFATGLICDVIDGIDKFLTHRIRGGFDISDGRKITVLRCEVSKPIQGAASDRLQSLPIRVPHRRFDVFLVFFYDLDWGNGSGEATQDAICHLQEAPCDAFLKRLVQESLLPFQPVSGHAEVFDVFPFDFVVLDHLPGALKAGLDLTPGLLDYFYEFVAEQWLLVFQVFRLKNYDVQPVLDQGQDCN